MAMARTPPAFMTKKKEIVIGREKGTPPMAKVKERTELASLLVKEAEGQMKESGNLKTSIKNRLTEVIKRMFEIIKDQEEEKDKMREELEQLRNGQGNKESPGLKQQVECLREEVKIIRGTTERLSEEIGEMIIEAVRNLRKSEVKAGGEIQTVVKELRDLGRTTEQMRADIAIINEKAPLRATDGRETVTVGGRMSAVPV